jgi:hypothetical protein
VVDVLEHIRYHERHAAPGGGLLGRDVGEPDRRLPRRRRRSTASARAVYDFTVRKREWIRWCWDQSGYDDRWLTDSASDAAERPVREAEAGASVERSPTPPTAGDTTLAYGG